MRRPVYILACSASLLCFFTFASTGTHESVSQTQTTAASEPTFTAPPGEETAEIRTLINKAQTLLAGGRIKQTDLLMDPEYMRAHEWPRFRKLIRQYATGNQTALVTPLEAGEPLIVSGTLRNRQSGPVSAAVIYVYQTSAKGWYSDKAPHISGMGGDEKHARLFAYLTTDRNGEFEFRTIRPAGYPRSNLPAHIHIEIVNPGNEPRTLISEILFDNDPRLTPEMRARTSREGLFIFPVTRGSDGVQRVKADFRL